MPDIRGHIVRIATAALLWAVPAPPVDAQSALPEPAAEVVPVPAAIAAIPLPLETALEWTLARNPDLIARRQDICVSAEAVRVARRFPTSLNPTVAVDACPWVFQRLPNGQIDRLDTLVSVTWGQPVELGHRTAHRTAIAEATYTQTQWSILQAELLALVGTYRDHQGAVYRREKLLVASRIGEYQKHLLQTLRNQREANRVPAADVVLTETETVAVEQQLETARQEYATALDALRRRIGIAEYAASIEPAGELQPPQPVGLDDERLIATALATRPDVQSARAQVCASRASIDLARADRIPIPSLGPVYEHNETGASFYGMALTSPIPVLNSGKPLVLQREAEYHRDVVALEQAQQRARTEVLAGLARWRDVQQSLARSRTWGQVVEKQAAVMNDLYDAGQADLLKLLTVRRRLLDVESARLDAAWNAIQAYADLLNALGASPLLCADGEPPHGAGE